jgi:hypothetical protein
MTIKHSKYNAKKCELDGYKFDSLKERQRYIDLMLMEQAGLIQRFVVHPKFELYAGIKYIGDFMVYGNNDKKWVEDVKGYETDVFKIKAKLFREKYPDIELRMVK